MSPVFDVAMIWAIRRDRSVVVGGARIVWPVATFVGARSWTKDRQCYRPTTPALGVPICAAPF